jgi:hypothetical protein
MEMPLNNGTYTYTCMHVYANVEMPLTTVRTHTHACMYMRYANVPPESTYVAVCAFVCVCVCVNVCRAGKLYICICMYTYMHIYIYAYIYIHTHAQNHTCAQIHTHHTYTQILTPA